MSLDSQGRRLSFPSLVHLEGQGAGSLGGGGLEDGIPHPLLIASSSLSGSGSPSQVIPELHQGECSSRGDSFSHREGSSRASSPPLRLCLVWKALGLRRPVIDLSHFNLFVLQTRFKMETSQLVLCAVRSDWMISIDLKDAYLQAPVHPDSRQFLRFVAFGKVYQFKALCFGL